MIDINKNKALQRKRIIIIACLALLICMAFCVCIIKFIFKEKKIEQIAEINLQVHDMLSYGNGQGTINEVLENGEGHCGYYAAILMYKLREMGIDCNIVGISSSSNLANHSVVECIISGNERYVFDPTNGVYYKNSIQKLLEVPELANECMYQVEESEVMEEYVASYFWQGVYSIQRIRSLVFIADDGYYTGKMGLLSTNIISMKVAGEEIDKVDLIDNNWNTYLLLSDKNIEIDLELERDIYGILAIDFISYFQDINNVDVYYYNDDTCTYECVPYSNKNMSHYEFYLGDRLLDKLKIVIEGNDTDRIVINEIILTEGLYNEVMN